MNILELGLVALGISLLQFIIVKAITQTLYCCKKSGKSRAKFNAHKKAFNGLSKILLIAGLPALLAACAKHHTIYPDTSSYQVKKTNCAPQGANYMICKDCIKYTDIRNSKELAEVHLPKRGACLDEDNRKSTSAM